MPDAGLYRRPLPSPLVPFASAEGRALFREALAAGGMEGYFPLAEQFHTQSEPAFCGLGTLVVALNALAVDPGRRWKGPWRWYGEELLDCCEPLDRVKERGIGFGELTCLAQCNGLAVEGHRPLAASADDLRRDLRAACGAAAGSVLVAAYSREALGQTGGGHYSPIGGFHEARDLALVLDVARFKYPPHWVSVDSLYRAMVPIDEATGRSRGWMVLTRGREPSPLAYYVSCEKHSCGDIVEALVEALPRELASERPASAEEAIRAVLRHAAPIADAFCERPLAGAPQREALETLLGALRRTEIFRIVARTGWAISSERATMLILTAPDESFATLPPGVRDQVLALRAAAALPPEVGSEIARLREQIAHLRDQRLAG